MGDLMANAQPNSSPPADPGFKVVVNAEAQYSIWPADREAPQGWDDAGFAGPKEDCLAHVECVWTDMRPASLRESMAAAR